MNEWIEGKIEGHNGLSGTDIKLCIVERYETVVICHLE